MEPAAVAAAAGVGLRRRERHRRPASDKVSGCAIPPVAVESSEIQI